MGGSSAGRAAGAHEVSEVPLCTRCGEHPCIVRRNGRPLPACSQCWGQTVDMNTRRQNARGYWRVKVEGGWRYEHVVIAETTLGRPLREDEHVGWADGDHSNNDPSNLRIGVVRYRPLVEAPKRPKDRTGEKHKRRTEVRLTAWLEARAQRAAARDGVSIAETIATYAARALNDDAL